MGTTSALSDRIKLLRKRQFPDINLSPQVLINCVTVSLTVVLVNTVSVYVNEHMLYVCVPC